MTKSPTGKQQRAQSKARSVLCAKYHDEFKELYIIEKRRAGWDEKLNPIIDKNTMSRAHSRARTKLVQRYPFEYHLIHEDLILQGYRRY